MANSTGDRNYTLTEDDLCSAELMDHIKVFLSANVKHCYLNYCNTGQCPDHCRSSICRIYDLSTVCE